MFFGVVYSTSVLAVGTDAGTDIENFATVDYKVGGVVQTPEVSPTTTFEVDQVVDFVVTEVGGADTDVGAGEQDAVAHFKVTNTGNATQDFALSVLDLVGGTVFSLDTIDTTDLTIVVDANDNDVYDAGVDLVQPHIDGLSADDTAAAALDNEISVFILGDIPTGVSDGSAANIELTATAYKFDGSPGLDAIEAESGVDDDPDTVQIVFSAAVDSGLTATFADQDGYLVASADLTVAKASVVLSDPLLQVAPAALAIPGAIVEYTITATNNGDLPATEIVISDDIQSDLALETGNYAGEDVQITKRDGSVVTCTADTGDGDIDGCGLAGSILTVSIPTTVDPDGISVLALADAPQNVVTVKFQVSIN
ncbi:MAG: hypothetical protein KJO27_07980 [Gammaproteobacteria bacterium]|nr:hypothetical protein [Gammaproteobacteria bacterium]NNL45346.1 hypothetical protein [Woeseiaceae bacterium]